MLRSIGNRTPLYSQLFPNGYCFTLADYTGYPNFNHVKPSITVQLIEYLAMARAAGLQWSETKTAMMDGI